MGSHSLQDAARFSAATNDQKSKNPCKIRIVALAHAQLSNAVDQSGDACICRRSVPRGPRIELGRYFDLLIVVIMVPLEAATPLTEPTGGVCVTPQLSVQMVSPHAAFHLARDVAAQSLRAAPRRATVLGA